MVKEDEITDFLKDVRRSLKQVVAPLATIIALLDLAAACLKEDSPHFSEIQKLEKKLQEILTTAQEIVEEKKTPTKSQRKTRRWTGLEGCLPF